ncbi:RNA polymerase subunit sigma-24 [Haloferula helveola]|uniref:RNA polymerase subunit sigma-24 n=1 Tax=Haloferula helveola TaxID=490095 RepID=A0ABN6H641_9BACT|nr:RNA polymerase subunit sigma-24 [Haloferula helveola]
MFFTTRWTLVSRASGETPEARAALGDLCEAYWNPVFHFLRREGRGEDESRELTQAFFAKVLTGAGIGNVSPDKGRFRSYLLGALKNFLANRKRDANREKRGGNAVVESIDGGGTDESPGMELADPGATADDAWFDRHWALAVMERGLDRVRQSFDQSGKTRQFEVLRPWLMGDPEGLTQADAAEELGMTRAAAKVAVHRLRQKFGEAIRSEIAETVDTEEEIAEELRYLIEVLRVA